MRQHTFGYLLKAWRVRRGATQQQLADLSTISVRAIRDLEFGRVARPRSDTVRLIADALRLTGRSRADFEAAAAGWRHQSHDDWDETPPPTPLDDLVGRDSEVSALRETLSIGSQRLITLTGLAGVGKTRLGLAASAATNEESGIPVVWVAAASQRDVTGAHDDLSRVAEAALTTPSSASSWDELSAYVRGRAALLVLDGYASGQLHGDRITALLRECGNLRILITTRVSPDIAGAWVLPLPPLRVPDTHDDLARVRSNPAIRLLVRQARLSRPDFDVTAGNADALTALCRAVDGIPAALAALAPWFMFYPPETLLEHLCSDPFAVLEHACLAGDAPDLASHLSALTEALEPAGRELLRKLARRTRPWTVNEAAAIGELDITTCARMIRHISAKGLARPLGDARFTVLELARSSLGVPRPIEQRAEPMRPRRAARPWVRLAMETAGLLPG